jgi:hypothetical protein
MVPKLTDPMVKFIRTGEGILIYLFNAAMVVIPILSNALSPAEALKWAAVVNVATVISRTGLKALTAVKGITGISPAIVSAPASLGPDAQSALQDVEAIVSGVQNRQETLEQKIDNILVSAPSVISDFDKTARAASGFRVDDSPQGVDTTQPFDQEKS